jgi:hypothetical protein
VSVDTHALCAGTFVASLVHVTVEQRHASLVLDLESHEDVLPSDLTSFATFATELADALHGAGRALSISVSPGKPIFDMPSLSATPADLFLDYGTYAADDDLFRRKLDDALKYVGADRLDLGLKSRHSNFSTAELAMRFDAAKAHNLSSLFHALFVWTNQDTILPSWLPFLEAFLSGGRRAS